MLHPLEEQRLFDGPACSFAVWPPPALPRVAAGVYTVWQGTAFIYVGMSGQGMTAARIAEWRAAGGRPLGLYDRLRSHRAGRRGSDQFCLYVGDRLVLPTLTPAEIAQVREGGLSLDARTRDFIRRHLAYRWVETADGSAARALEKRLRQGHGPAGPPMLNPLG